MSRMKRDLLGIVAMATAVLTVSPVLAQGIVAQNIPLAVPTLTEVLRLIAEGGIAGLILSWMLEHIAYFQHLSSEQKKWGALVTSLLLPVIAEVLLRYVPAAFWAAVAPFWIAAARGFVAWGASQWNYHQVIHPAQVRRQSEIPPVNGIDIREIE